MSTYAPHKLSPHSTLCVFLGYSSNHKGFRCLDLSSYRIIIFHHIIFNENTFPFAKTPHPPPLMILIVWLFERQGCLPGLPVGPSLAGPSGGVDPPSPLGVSPTAVVTPVTPIVVEPVDLEIPCQHHSAPRAAPTTTTALVVVPAAPAGPVVIAVNFIPVPTEMVGMPRTIT